MRRYGATRQLIAASATSLNKALCHLHPPRFGAPLNRNRAMIDGAAVGTRAFFGPARAEWKFMVRSAQIGVMITTSAFAYGERPGAMRC